jgi:lipopolysaccharide/colanic/teichoic acid biosynthesis glycosyltransferase
MADTKRVEGAGTEIDMSDQIHTYGGYEADVTPSPYLNSRSKRIFDLLGALIGLLILLVIGPIIAIAIKSTSRGSVFYRQPRVGQNGAAFQVVKFRTMREDAERDSGPTWAVANDNRITGIGRLLRKSYLDEIPQFWNVFTGEMSLIGPRPERPELIDTIELTVPKFRSRLEAKPGMSGLAQVIYRYGSTVEDARVKLRLDRLYVSTASLAVDLKIMARTLIHVVSRRGS